MDYNLEERTAKFGENIIVFVRNITKDEITRPLINQIVKSSTSIGANYMEANQGSSKKDFRNKITICRKESNETKHWLRMISKALPENTEECRKLWKEAHELTLIFAKIIKSCDVKN
jgi:four helix bundle protein